jgi:ABC-type transport system involved in cytochrome c biogenesis permease subunit
MSHAMMLNPGYWPSCKRVCHGDRHPFATWLGWKAECKMFELSVPEVIALLLVVAVHAAAGLVAALQLVASGRRHEHLLVPLVVAAVVLDAVMLGLRAVSIGAVPLTGLFESLLVLALVFGVLYLLLRPTIDQVWFGSVMVWVIFGMILMAALVAKPASRPEAVAATPWALAHATAMILASASIMFAAASSILYLLGSRRLKRKKIVLVLGRIPNMETLARMNWAGVRVGFVLLMLGVVSGLCLAFLHGPGIAQWLMDVKVICIISAWGLLGAILILDRLHLLKVKARAYATLVVFVLILVGIVGVTVTGATQHRFSLDCSPGAAALTA